MKYFYSLLLFLILSINIIPKTFSLNKGYKLSITIKGVPKDSSCFLAYYYGDKQYLRDTAKVQENGKMVFEKKDSLPGGIYLLVLPNKSYFEFIITEKEQNFSLETDTAGLVTHMKISGSTENSAFYKYLLFISHKQKEVEPLHSPYKKLLLLRDSLKEEKLSKTQKDSIKLLKEKIEIINEDVKKFKENFMKENPNVFVSKVIKASEEIDVPDAPILPNGRKDSLFSYYYYKSHFFDNIDLKDDRMIRTPIYHNKIKQFFSTVVVQNTDSIMKEVDLLVEKTRESKELFKYSVWYITNTYETSQYMGMDAIFVHMVDKYYATKQAFWLADTILTKIIDRANKIRPNLIGQKAQNLIMNDINGIQQVLYNIQAKYTVLVYWDSDCGHCKKVVPALYELYPNLKAKGVEVFAVNIEQKEEGWKKFIEEKGLKDWINVIDIHDRNRFRQFYDIYSTPVIYLLDDKKVIQGKRLPVEQLEEFIGVLEKRKEKNN